MTVKAYRYQEDTDSYEHVTTLHDDATVDGDDDEYLTALLQSIVDELSDHGYNPANYYAEIEERLLKNYTSFYLRFEVE